MSDIDENLSDVAKKPIADAIDALLGPKLKQLKEWSEVREAKKQAEQKNLDKRMSRYLDRFLRTASHLQSIVFPQSNLPLNVIYEPLIVGELEPTYEQSVVSVPQLCAIEEHITVIDNGGMGKTTFAKHVSLQIFDHWEKIPIFFNLRQLGHESDLADEVRAELNELGQNFPKRLFETLLENGRLFIVLDGFDEIDPPIQVSARSQIEDLARKCGLSRMMLTSRPQSNIPNLENGRVFRLEPLIKSQAESLVQRYDKFADIDIGKKLIREFDQVPEEFLETPLLVALLYKTYSYNSSIATKISAFYNDVYEALFKGHDLTKSGFARTKKSGLDVNEFRRLLRAFSFTSLVYGKREFESSNEVVRIINEAATLVSAADFSPQDFLDDLLVAVPMMVNEGPNYRFSHSTFGEYFGAEHIAFGNIGERILKNISDAGQENKFRQVFDFLHELNPDLFRRQFTLPLATTFLSTSRTTRSDILHTARCMLTGYISIWPRVEVEYRAEDGSNTIRPSTSPPVSYGKNSYFYGDLNGEEHVAIFQSDVLSPYDRLLLGSWREMSHVVDDDELSNFSHFDYEFSEISGRLRLRRWYALESNALTQCASIRPLSRILCKEIHHQTIFVGRAHELRVLDEAKCSSILERI